MRTYIFTMDTGRFGDEVIVRAPDVETARKSLTRTQKKKERGVREFIGTSERRAQAEAAGLPFPSPIERKRR